MEHEKYETVGKVLARIRKKSGDETEKGMWFENLFGYARVPLQADAGGYSLDKETAKALCAYFNSTVGALLFLNIRSTMLTDLMFSQHHLKSLMISDFRYVIPLSLIYAFEKTQHLKIHPWKNPMDDPVRYILDRAVCNTIDDLDLEKIIELRSKISIEPTVSNKLIDLKYNNSMQAA